MNSHLLDIILVNAIASTSSTSTSSHASTRSSPCVTVIVVVGVDASTSQTVSSGGVACGTGGASQLSPPLVPTKGLLPVSGRCTGLLLRLTIITIIVIELGV
jgi:hypothetical protein